jgi:hypothetical protein
MFNHDTERGCPYCPIMKEVCVDGWTKSMGEDEKGRRGKCAAWRALPMVDLPTQKTKTIHACAVYEWPPFLGFELSGMMGQARASVDKVATETSKAATAANSLKKAFFAALPGPNRGQLTAQNGMGDETPRPF